MRKLFALVALSTLAFAGDSTLAVDATPDDTGMFQDVTISLSGSTPDALHYLAIGQTPGMTDLSTGMFTLIMGLEQPFAITPLGVSDATGAIDAGGTVPAGLGLTLYGQAVGVGVEFGQGPPSFSLCVSNVDDVAL